MKKVSVVIPAYNKAELTVRTVKSVLAQSYKNIELIVVDDGSTDSTQDVLAPFADKISYYKKENGGACSARNFGIRKSTGEYIALIDCDDLYAETKIEKSVAMLEADLELGYVHSRVVFIDMDDKPLKVYGFPLKGQIFKKLLRRNKICNSTIVVRKKCFDKVGLFDESIFIPADWDMWLRLAQQYKVGYIHEPLSFYRVEGCYTLKNIDKAELEERYMLDKYLNLDCLSKLDRKIIEASFYARSANNYLLAGENRKALELFKNSIKIWPFNAKVFVLILASAIDMSFVRSLLKLKYYSSNKVS